MLFLILDILFNLFSENVHRKYARAAKGEKICEKVKGKRFERLSIVAGQAGNRIIAPLQYKGTMTSIFFDIWFEKHLIPRVAQGTVIVMDNASFHRKKRLHELAEEYNVKIVFCRRIVPN